VSYGLAVELPISTGCRPVFDQGSGGSVSRDRSDIERLSLKSDMKMVEKEARNYGEARSLDKYVGSFNHSDFAAELAFGTSAERGSGKAGRRRRAEERFREPATERPTTGVVALDERQHQ
jgi:hypothetical protein